MQLRRLANYGHFVLTLTAPDGRSWSGQAWNVFAALGDLRLQTEAEGVLICCNGARLTVSCSTMAADMSEGFCCEDFVKYERDGRPEIVDTLGESSSESIVTCAEQEKWFEDFSG